MKLQIGGYTACVLVDGQESECYDIRVSDDGNTVECWIISEVGKEFSVDYTYPANVTATAHLYIDGVYARGGCLNWPTPKPVPASKITNVYTSATTARPLQFSKIELTDDDQYLGAEVKDSNTLKLRLQQVKFSASTIKPAFLPKKIPGSTKIHERTKKGLLAHGVGVGQEYTVTTVDSPSSFEKIGEPSFFIFRYTSRALLVAEGIIQAPASRVASLAAEGREENEVVKTEKHLSSNAAQVKRERPVPSSGDVLDLTGPEYEPANKRRKPPKGQRSREVVDLTLD